MDNFVIADGNPAPELAQAIWFDGPEGRRLRAMFAPALSRFSSPRGTVVIVCPGRTEFIEKYFEVARDMQARGFAVVVFDWPGQGLSGRDLPDPLAGYVDSFETFVEALRRGLIAIGQKAVRPHVMLAHSMGGAIGLEAMRSGGRQHGCGRFQCTNVGNTASSAGDHDHTGSMRGRQWSHGGVAPQDRRRGL